MSKRFVMAKVQPGGQRSVVGGQNFATSDEQPVVDKPIEIGTKVRTSMGSVGTVEKIDKDAAEVLVGAMRLREKLKNLQAIGDVHASMGDGEVSGTGIEISGEVMVSVTVLKGKAPAPVCAGEIPQ